MFYSYAVLSHLVGPKGRVYSVELVSELVELAKVNLNKAGIVNVAVVNGDGNLGYSEKAPYDRIIVTAGANKIPKELLCQLKRGGVMVIPVTVGGSQVMKKIVKEDSLNITEHGHFRFVPLIEK